jgi:hypothetical protein
MARAPSLAEFQKSFPDEESCAAFLFKQRWPDEALLGLATHQEPTGYWDIIKRDNPRKRTGRSPAPRLLHIDGPEPTG